MSLLANSYAIAGAIYVRDVSKPLAEQGADLYEVVDGLGYNDDFKADLYAQLEDNLTDETSFVNAVTIINDSLYRTHQRHG